MKPRNLIGALFPLLVAVAIGFAVRDGRPIGVPAAVATGAVFAFGAGAVMTTADLQRDDWRGIAQTVGPTSDARLVVARSTADDPLLFYLDGGVAKVRESSNEDARGGPRVFRARVSEVVVVTNQAPAARVAPGFRLVEERHEHLSDVHRYRAAEPRPLDVAELEGRRLVGRGFTVLLQTPSGERLLSVAESRRELR